MRFDFGVIGAWSHSDRYVGDLDTLLGLDGRDRVTQRTLVIAS